MTYMGWILIVVMHNPYNMEVITMQEFNGNVACEAAAKEVVKMSPKVQYTCMPKGLMPAKG